MWGSLGLRVDLGFRGLRFSERTARFLNFRIGFRNPLLGYVVYLFAGKGAADFWSAFTPIASQEP